MVSLEQQRMYTDYGQRSESQNGHGQMIKITKVKISISTILPLPTILLTTLWNSKISFRINL